MNVGLAEFVGATRVEKKLSTKDVELNRAGEIRNRMLRKTKMHFLILILIMLSTVQAQTPVISRRIYPDKNPNRLLEKAIWKYLTPVDEDPGKYIYNRVDLNRDGKAEALVYLFGGKSCGTSGCAAAVFQEKKGTYRLVTEFGPARNPIFVAKSKTNGWNDLIFFNEGGGILPGYYSIVRFDGRTYYDNPTILKRAPKIRGKLAVTSYLSGKSVSGISLKLEGKNQ